MINAIKLYRTWKLSHTALQVTMEPKLYEIAFDNFNSFACTAILYRASTGPEQGFPCEFFHTGKNLFSLQGNPVLIAGTLFSLQGFPCENFLTGKTLFSLQGMGLQ